MFLQKQFFEFENHVKIKIGTDFDNSRAIY